MARTNNPANDPFEQYDPNVHKRSPLWAFDLETNLIGGRSTDDLFPLSISFRRVRRTGSRFKLTDEGLDTLVYPPGTNEQNYLPALTSILDQKITTGRNKGQTLGELLHLTPETWAQQGAITQEELAQRVNEMLESRGSRSPVLIGHNINEFDTRVLSNVLTRGGLPGLSDRGVMTLDTLKLAREIDAVGGRLGAFGNYTLDNLAVRFNIRVPGLSHAAAHDVEASVGLANTILPYLLGRTPARSQNPVAQGQLPNPGVLQPSSNVTVQTAIGTLNNATRAGQPTIGSSINTQPAQKPPITISSNPAVKPISGIRLFRPSMSLEQLEERVKETLAAANIPLAVTSRRYEEEGFVRFGIQKGNVASAGGEEDGSEVEPNLISIDLMPGPFGRFGEDTLAIKYPGGWHRYFTPQIMAKSENEAELLPSGFDTLKRIVERSYTDPSLLAAFPNKSVSSAQQRFDTAVYASGTEVTQGYPHSERVMGQTVSSITVNYDEDIKDRSLASQNIFQRIKTSHMEIAAPGGVLDRMRAGEKLSQMTQAEQEAFYWGRLLGFVPTKDNDNITRLAPLFVPSGDKDNPLTVLGIGGSELVSTIKRRTLVAGRETANLYQLETIVNAEGKKEQHLVLAEPGEIRGKKRRGREGYLRPAIAEYGETNRNPSVVQNDVLLVPGTPWSGTGYLYRDPLAGQNIVTGGYPTTVRAPIGERLENLAEASFQFGIMKTNKNKETGEITYEKVRDLEGTVLEPNKEYVVGHYTIGGETQQKPIKISTEGAPIILAGHPYMAFPSHMNISGMADPGVGIGRRFYSTDKLRERFRAKNPNLQLVTDRLDTELYFPTATITGVAAKGQGLKGLWHMAPSIQERGNRINIEPSVMVEGEEAIAKEWTVGAITGTAKDLTQVFSASFRFTELETQKRWLGELSRLQGKIPSKTPWAEVAAKLQNYYTAQLSSGDEIRPESLAEIYARATTGEDRSFAPGEPMHYRGQLYWTELMGNLRYATEMMPANKAYQRYGWARVGRQSVDYAFVNDAEKKRLELNAQRAMHLWMRKEKGIDYLDEEGNVRPEGEALLRKMLPGGMEDIISFRPSGGKKTPWLMSITTGENAILARVASHLAPEFISDYPRIGFEEAAGLEKQFPGISNFTGISSKGPEAPVDTKYGFRAGRVYAYQQMANIVRYRESGENFPSIDEFPDVEGAGRVFTPEEAQQELAWMQTQEATGSLTLETLKARYGDAPLIARGRNQTVLDREVSLPEMVMMSPGAMSALSYSKFSKESEFYEPVSRMGKTYTRALKSFFEFAGGRLPDPTLQRFYEEERSVFRTATDTMKNQQASQTRTSFGGRYGLATGTPTNISIISEDTYSKMLSEIAVNAGMTPRTSEYRKWMKAARQQLLRIGGMPLLSTRYPTESREHAWLLTMGMTPRMIQKRFGLSIEEASRLTGKIVPGSVWTTGLAALLGRGSDIQSGDYDADPFAGIVPLKGNRKFGKNNPPIILPEETLQYINQGPEKYHGEIDEALRSFLGTSGGVPGGIWNPSVQAMGDIIEGVLGSPKKQPAGIVSGSAAEAYETAGAFLEAGKNSMGSEYNMQRALTVGSEYLGMGNAARSATSVHYQMPLDAMWKQYLKRGGPSYLRQLISNAFISNQNVTNLQGIGRMSSLSLMSVYGKDQKTGKPQYVRLWGQSESAEGMWRSLVPLIDQDYLSFEEFVGQTPPTEMLGSLLAMRSEDINWIGERYLEIKEQRKMLGDSQKDNPLVEVISEYEKILGRNYNIWETPVGVAISARALAKTAYKPAEAGSELTQLQAWGSMPYGALPFLPQGENVTLREAVERMGVPNAMYQHLTRKPGDPKGIAPLTPEQVRAVSAHFTSKGIVSQIAENISNIYGMDTNARPQKQSISPAFVPNPPNAQYELSSSKLATISFADRPEYVKTAMAGILYANLQQAGMGAVRVSEEQAIQAGLTINQSLKERGMAAEQRVLERLKATGEVSEDLTNVIHGIPYDRGAQIPLTHLYRASELDDQGQYIGQFSMHVTPDIMALGGTEKEPTVKLWEVKAGPSQRASAPHQVAGYAIMMSRLAGFDSLTQKPQGDKEAHWRKFRPVITNYLQASGVEGNEQELNRVARAYFEAFRSGRVEAFTAIGNQEFQPVDWKSPKMEEAHLRAVREGMSILTVPGRTAEVATNLFSRLRDAGVPLTSEQASFLENQSPQNPFVPFVQRTGGSNSGNAGRGGNSGNNGGNNNDDRDNNDNGNDNGGNGRNSRNAGSPNDDVTKIIQQIMETLKAIQDKGLPIKLNTGATVSAFALNDNLQEYLNLKKTVLAGEPSPNAPLEERQNFVGPKSLEARFRQRFASDANINEPMEDILARVSKNNPRELQAFLTENWGDIRSMARMHDLAVRLASKSTALSMAGRDASLIQELQAVATGKDTEGGFDASLMGLPGSAFLASQLKRFNQVERIVSPSTGLPVTTPIFPGISKELLANLFVQQNANQQLFKNANYGFLSLGEAEQKLVQTTTRVSAYNAAMDFHQNKMDILLKKKNLTPKEQEDLDKTAIAYAKAQAAYMGALREQSKIRDEIAWKGTERATEYVTAGFAEARYSLFDERMAELRSRNPLASDPLRRMDIAERERTQGYEEARDKAAESVLKTQATLRALGISPKRYQGETPEETLKLLRGLSVESVLGESYFNRFQKEYESINNRWKKLERPEDLQTEGDIAQWAIKVVEQRIAIEEKNQRRRGLSEERKQEIGKRLDSLHALKQAIPYGLSGEMVKGGLGKQITEGVEGAQAIIELDIKNEASERLFEYERAQLEIQQRGERALTLSSVESRAALLERQATYQAKKKRFQLPARELKEKYEEAIQAYEDAQKQLDIRESTLLESIEKTGGLEDTLVKYRAAKTPAEKTKAATELLSKVQAMGAEAPVQLQQSAKELTELALTSQETELGRAKTEEALEEMSTLGGKFGSMARKLFGGFGLLYMRSIAGLVTTGAYTGYQERLAYEQQMGQQFLGLGGGLPSAAPERIRRIEALQYGGSGGLGLQQAREYLMGNMQPVYNLATTALAGVSAGGMAAWALQGSVGDKLAGRIGAGVGASIALTNSMLNVASAYQDISGSAISLSTREAKGQNPYAQLALSTAGTTILGGALGGALLGTALAPGVGTLIGGAAGLILGVGSNAQAFAAITNKEVRQEKELLNQLINRGTLTSIGEVLAQNEITPNMANLARYGRMTAQIVSGLPGYEGITPEAIAAVEAQAARYGMGMTDEERKFLAEARMAGIDTGEIASNLMRLAGYTVGEATQQYRTRTPYLKPMITSYARYDQTGSEWDQWDVKEYVAWKETTTSLQENVYKAYTDYMMQSGKSNEQIAEELKVGASAIQGLGPSMQARLRKLIETGGTGRDIAALMEEATKIVESGYGEQYLTQEKLLAMQAATGMPVSPRVDYTTFAPLSLEAQQRETMRLQAEAIIPQMRQQLMVQYQGWYGTPLTLSPEMTAGQLTMAETQLSLGQKMEQSFLLAGAHPVLAKALTSETVNMPTQDYRNLSRLMMGSPLQRAAALLANPELAKTLVGTALPGLAGSTIPGQYIGMTDIGSNGQLTGLSWGTTSLALPAQVAAGMSPIESSRQVAQMIFGAPSSPYQAGLFEAYAQGGQFGAQAYQQVEAAKLQLASSGIAFAHIALQEKYQPLFWQLEDRSRQLGYRQTEFGFAQQEAQLAMQQRFFQQNMALQAEQMQLQRGWTQEDWAYQGQMRELQWGWRLEDFQEQSRFMTGRDRRIAERQMRRETIVHEAEEGQIEKQKNRQQELWRLEDERFSIQKQQNQEQLKFQQEALEKQREFYEERKKIEEAHVKLQREYWKEQIELQKQSAGISAASARQNIENAEAQLKLTQFMQQMLTKEGSLFSEETQLRLAILFQQSTTSFDAFIRKFEELMRKMGKEIPAHPEATGGPGIGQRAIVGDAGPEIIDLPIGSSVIPNNVFNAEKLGYQRFRDPWENITFERSFARRANESGAQVINIYVGNEKLASFVVDTINNELSV